MAGICSCILFRDDESWSSQRGSYRYDPHEKVFCFFLVFILLKHIVCD